MSRYNLDYSARPHVVPAEQQQHHFYPNGQHDRDERGSLSGSDDGSYAQYIDPLKVETDTEDESTALTSQTLNADGTPKRPMNAFMIFARRRRPQVSAENQAMRTGEISKILSKEWNAMQSGEKQFYQEQAKQLKDSFNNRYPDYVYRRRPNNSRKRRKPEGPGSRSTTDNPLPLDMGDDMSTFGDVGESPTDGEDHSAPEVSLGRGRLSHDVHQSYNDQQGKYASSSSSRGSPYAYTIPDHSYRANGTHDPRSYGSGSERVPSSSLAPPTNLNYQYSVPMQVRSHSQSISNPVYDSNGHKTWDTAVGHPPYLGGGLPRQQALHPTVKAHSYSTSSSQSPWQSSPTTPSTSSAPPFLLPTLSSPFHPSPSSPEDSLANPTSCAASNSMSQSPYNSDQLHTIMPMKQEYINHGYHHHPSSSTSQAGVLPSSSGLYAGYSTRILEGLI
ncbi:hypothetical protein BDZ94DRAFT_1302115 [Collybia nuda]|uniref:HMG box domain-containing protein n=1 Tax=Collybia nuda TaxID=64659 RepID=A0A9P6C9F9_9AGAR|nr:hypothetical protein BDZ94DRAFT_1302115 [Collybia nuda]